MSEHWTPEDYQKEGVKRILQNACQGLLWKPGLRKTSTMLAAISILKKKKLINKVLVISTKRIINMTWPDEVAKWKDFRHLKLAVLHGDNKNRIVESEAESADILLLSCDVSALSWFFYDRQLHKKLNVDMLIIDESSKFKNSTSTRFKGYPRQKGKIVAFPGLKHYVKHFRRRVIATGSPRPKGIENFFSQIYILDEGAALGQYISNFRDRFMTPTGYGGYNWLPKPGALEHINHLIKPLVHVVNNDALKNLPEVVYQHIPVELPPAARKIYDEMDNEFITQLQSGVVKAASAGVASGKCRQVANGALFYHEMKELPNGIQIRGERKWELVHSEKLSALDELLEQLDGEQLFVCYEFQHDLERIKDYLENKANCTYGVMGESDKNDERLKQKWNSGELEVLVGHPASVGHGLNMQESGAFNICLFGLSWNYEDVSQVIRRLARSGNTSSRVYVWMIIAQNTVDEVVVATLLEREEGEEGFFTALNEYRAKRTGGAVKMSSAEFLHTVSTALETNNTVAYSEDMLTTYLKMHLKRGALQPQEVESYVRGWWKADYTLRYRNKNSKEIANLSNEKSCEFLKSVANLLPVSQSTSPKGKQPMKVSSAKSNKKAAAEPKATKPSKKEPSTAVSSADTKPRKKAAAEPKATKPAKAAPAETGTTRGRNGKFKESMKIVLKVKENPKRAGSASYTRFELYRTRKTVGDFYAAGGTSGDLHFDSDKGFIEVI